MAVTETGSPSDAYRMREISEKLARVAEEIGDALKLASGLQAGETVAPIAQAWREAPIQLRLRFAQDLLKDGSELKQGIAQAVALIELANRGAELEAWIGRHPAQFADAYMLISRELQRAANEAGDASVMLGRAELAGADIWLQAALGPVELMWIDPAPGSEITMECEVVREEPSTYPKGACAAIVRAGLSLHGSLALRAQVVRSSGAGHSIPQIAPEPPPLPAAGQEPEWLALIVQRTFGCGVPAVSRLTGLLQQAAQGLSGAASSEDGGTGGAELDPLLQVLGMRYADHLPEIPAEWGLVFLDARQAILTWLNNALSIEPISPERGDAFNQETMEAVEERKTVHLNEIGTVARIERVGLRRAQGETLVPARVVLYIAGRG